MLNAEKKYMMAMCTIILICLIILLLPTDEKIPDTEITNEQYFTSNKVKLLIISIGDFTDSLSHLQKVYKNPYDIIEYHTSENVQLKDWNEIANIIFRDYTQYDAFIILQNSETICYTASALSFILENLGKTVVVTTDVIGAVTFASKYTIPEVVILDSGVVFRGCRTTISRGRFVSPNFETLATLKHDKIILNKEIILKQPVDQLKLLLFNPNKKILILKIFNSRHLQNILQQDNIYGLILESNRNVVLDHNFLKLLQNAIKKGLLVINMDNTPQVLKDIGVIPSGDMTTEAIYCKLFLIISHVHKYTPEMAQKLLETGLRGEI